MSAEQLDPDAAMAEMVEAVTMEPVVVAVVHQDGRGQVWSLVTDTAANRQLTAELLRAVADQHEAALPSTT